MDVCARSHLRAFGNTGSDDLSTAFLQRLRDAGISDDEQRCLFVDYPRAALTGED